MNKKVEKLHNELRKDRFVTEKCFEKFRFDESNFTAFASSLMSRSGRKITCSFNVHDGKPNQVEFVMQLHNKTSFEQVKVICEDVSEAFHREIDIYDDHNSISIVSYFDFDETEDMTTMMKYMLQQINKITIFLIN